MTPTAMTNATGADLHAFIRYRFGMGDRLYAVVDAARDKGPVLAARDRCGRTPRWLFEDAAAAHMSEVAPYLIDVDFRTKYPYPGSDYLDLWAEHLGRSAGILLITPAETDALLGHLRGLFHVTDEEDHKYFLRFYDPRVLRVFLPTCTAAQAREFFGPIRRILVESERQRMMLSCAPDLSGVRIDERPLQSNGTPRRTGGASQ